MKKYILPLGYVFLMILSGCTQGVHEEKMFVDTQDDTVITKEGESIVINVLQNDSIKYNYKMLTLYVSEIETSPSHGTATIGSDDQITYVPDDNYHGTDRFTYIASTSDNSRKNDATVTITINELSENIVPRADAGENKTVQVDDTITITGTGTDIDGNIIAYQWEENNTLLASTAIFEYTPTIVGVHELVLTVTDNDGATGQDEMNVTATKSSNSRPTAEAETISLSECPLEPIEITLKGNDTDGDSLTYIKVTDPIYGTVSIEGNIAIYQLTDITSVCESGETDHFSFKVNDGTEDSSPAIITIQLG